MPEPVLPPQKRPCASCPYRKDIPSGIWHESEYEKLPPFDEPETAGTVFLCHQQTGHLCAGWVGVHDMDNMLGLRILTLQGRISLEDVDAVLDYTTDVPLHESGRAAADHGMDLIADPPPKAHQVISKLLKQNPPKPRRLG